MVRSSTDHTECGFFNYWNFFCNETTSFLRNESWVQFSGGALGSSAVLKKIHCCTEKKIRCYPKRSCILSLADWHSSHVIPCI